ncbi:hypothetical protein RJ639_004361 [Escallonia herrerae]|uniref:F-box domain-containing protein n=1 Tax=Escallonia herrerae TaxID=1293975 RepID=A0AA88W3B0_9ASTE|nr:hypothetical protein RJ639_004361 [Escallonia herrerae]
MSDYIPQEVLVDILTRLPIKNIVQCACVCKSWQFLITNPSFVTAHLNRSLSSSSSSSSADKNLVLVRTCVKEEEEAKCEEKYSLHYDDDKFGEHCILQFTMPHIYMTIIGCFNGLVCLSDDYHYGYVEELFLWNPSIRKVLPLHPLRVGFRSHGPFSHAIGFGYDPLTNDYKVVRIVHLECDEDGPAEVDVYSLNTGKWRNISRHSGLGLQYHVEERGTQAFVNGAVHWVAFQRRSDERPYRSLIVSFHMGDEMFRTLELPSALSNAYIGFQVVVNRESLSLVENCKVDKYEIWVMKEYGRVNSWTKVITVDVNARFDTVVALRRKGEILMVTNWGNLASLDPMDNSVKNLGIHTSRDSESRRLLHVDAYIESLVSLGVKCCDDVGCNGVEDHGRKRIARKKSKKKGSNRFVWKSKARKPGRLEDQ